MDIKDINKKIIGSEITISGWIKNHRKQAKFGFIDLNDGTCFNSLQVVYNDELDDFSDIQKLKLGYIRLTKMEIANFFMQSAMYFQVIITMEEE